MKNSSHRLTIGIRSFVQEIPVFVTTALLACLAPSNTHAQETIAGRTYLSLGGGLSFGPGILWGIQRQPLLNPNIRVDPGDPQPIDSIFVNQAVESGASFLVSVTRYPNTHLGLGADIAYHGYQSKQDCSVAFDAAIEFGGGSDSTTVSSPNRSTCQDVRGRARDAITLDIAPFIAWRLSPDTEISPMLKIGGGLSLGPCTVRVNSPLRDLVNGPCSGSARPVFGGSIGFYRQTEIESQFHFEFKFSFHRWDVIDGPVDLNGVGQTSTVWKGTFGFSMGVDFQV